ncbi:transcription repressor NadR [Alicyclobacillus dauci]|uniref:Transcription repressor NadR n=1 Tax=Alicyclobacillus dauci TaxID=1475485 RepID=A0ABY6Z156_9BACL|nr:transcription repressor NadR [Alicyclobacillus dauci]WAH36556.1 transcription repressor NadR [Alicyclobacillus dauci]
MSELTSRQQSLLKIIQSNSNPVSGQALAKELDVTRQVVVHDIALLRALGYSILSTPKGYMLNAETATNRVLLAVSHTPEQTGTELNVLVDCGLRVIDVRVEHQVYGEIVGNLYLSSRRDVEHFLRKIAKDQAPLLSSLTDGLHYHLVEYGTADQLADAVLQLKLAGIKVID